MRPLLIISGGQTGADQGGLEVATTLGIPTGGWAPKGYMTENGENRDLKNRYGLEEHESCYDYAPRTEANVKLADATLICGRRSPSSNLTESLCQRYKKPLLWVREPFRERLKVRLWLQRVQPETLNIAGNRESRNPGIGEDVAHLLLWMFSEH